MNLTAEHKEYIFSLIKEYFDWNTPEVVLEGEFMDTFYENNERCDTADFDISNGAVKYCISSFLFHDYVVKFCCEDFDYCEREYSNYLAAVERKLEMFFPFTDYLGNLNGINYYVQERAECDDDYVTSIWYENLKESCQDVYENETEEELNDRIWDMIWDLEDEERVQMLYNVEELEQFLYDYRINDLHSGNFGLIGERLVIIDFSGFGYMARERSF